VFWLDALRDASDDSVGVLCLRHADAMVVPRDWTLDDLRDPDLRLFRPPPADPTDPPVRRRAARRDRDDTEQLALVVADGPAAEPMRAAAVPAAWTPSFDARDDLDGLLAARSPLLARAFRGEDRDRP